MLFSIFYTYVAQLIIVVGFLLTGKFINKKEFLMNLIPFYWLYKGISYNWKLLK